MPKPTVDPLRAAIRKAVKREPLWRGPEVDGITQSLLGRFLSCKERFRKLVVEGLRSAESFSHRMEYGTFWHLAEEHFGEKGGGWEKELDAYCAKLRKLYPLQQADIVHWANICKMQFPIYTEYWSRKPEPLKVSSVFREQVFSVLYTLPSGRKVRMRGKWDGVDLLGAGSQVGLWLNENKTKGDINEHQLQRQLMFDTQTMWYIIALQEYQAGAVPDNGRAALQGLPIRGVCYNVVRRPLAGGKHSIRQHKPTKANPRGESLPDFYDRLAELIREEPEHYFMRWTVTISPEDIANFKVRCLHPVLESLLDWWEWVAKDPFDPWREGNTVHFQFPYGIFLPLLDGGSTELDEHLASGSLAGLAKIDSLFTELE